MIGFKKDIYAFIFICIMYILGLVFINVISLPNTQTEYFSIEFLNIWNNHDVLLMKNIQLLKLGLEHALKYAIVIFISLSLFLFVVYLIQDSLSLKNIINVIFPFIVLPSGIYGLVFIVSTHSLVAFILGFFTILLFKYTILHEEDEHPEEAIVFTILIGNIFFIIPFGLLFNLEFALVFFAGLILTATISFYKLYLYIYYFFKGYHSKLDSNPYLTNTNIFSSLYIIDTKLVEEAKKNPQQGYEFSSFLYSKRKNNLELASKIRHASFSGELFFNPLKENLLNKLDISSDTIDFIPSKTWNELLSNIKEQIISYESETHITLKVEKFQELVRMIKKLQLQNEVESSKWNYLYTDSFDKWLDEAEKKLINLNIQQQDFEPIQKNIYRYGIPLQPNRDELIFLGRDEIKEELSLKLLTTDRVPALMVQGQRRVGKTSFINFLPELLGSRFKIAKFDCQGLEKEDFSVLLRQIKIEIDKTLSLEEIEIKFTGRWSVDWGLFVEYLNNIVLKDNIKLLVVLDEYEIIHKIFQKKLEESIYILGRMRHFLQHQNNISFIFVGLYTFDDLVNPNWSEYLVHYERFKIPYLSEKDSIKLISCPTTNFNLKYQRGVVEKLFYYTQGHPSLIQLICTEIVNISNKNSDSIITMKILDDVVKEVVSNKGLAPAIVFWRQLCNDNDKDTVKKILNNKEVDNKKSLYKLEDYGFIKDHEIVVPIFEMWLWKFMDIVE